MKKLLNEKQKSNKPMKASKLIIMRPAQGEIQYFLLEKTEVKITKKQIPEKSKKLVKDAEIFLKELPKNQNHILELDI